MSFFVVVGLQANQDSPRHVFFHSHCQAFKFCFPQARAGGLIQPGGLAGNLSGCSLRVFQAADESSLEAVCDAGFFCFNPTIYETAHVEAGTTLLSWAGSPIEGPSMSLPVPSLGWTWERVPASEAWRKVATRNDKQKRGVADVPLPATNERRTLTQYWPQRLNL